MNQVIQNPSLDQANMMETNQVQASQEVQNLNHPRESMQDVKLEPVSPPPSPLPSVLQQCLQKMEDECLLHSQDAQKGEEQLQEDHQEGHLDSPPPAHQTDTQQNVNQAEEDQGKPPIRLKINLKALSAIQQQVSLPCNIKNEL